MVKDFIKEVFFFKVLVGVKQNLFVIFVVTTIKN